MELPTDSLSIGRGSVKKSTRGWTNRLKGVRRERERFFNFFFIFLLLLLFIYIAHIVLFRSVSAPKKFISFQFNLF